jgi:hypothetical protein
MWRVSNKSRQDRSNLLHHGQKPPEYDKTIWDARDAQRDKRLEAKLKRQGKQLGYELVPIAPKAA